MIKRALSQKLKWLSSKFPVVSVVGPRQSGKTTLVKNVFPKLTYVSLEDLDIREFALQDPRGFLSNYRNGAIIDEVQRVPDLFSYIQTFVDQQNTTGNFILTGSQNFLFQENISQTLAGRTAILTLLPLSLGELKETPYKLKGSQDYILKGFYPRIYDQKIPPADWYPNYIQTYIERDARLIKNISNLNTFQKFIRLCAGRSGQILNLSSLGNDCGITHNTAKAWLSVLESSYIVFLLRPYYKNFNKRLIKMPKLYFYDTGLVCSLLGIQNREQLVTHYLKGSLFETLIISEIIKKSFNKGILPHCYYWRDKTGHEIDCLIEKGIATVSIEIKSGKTINDDFFAGLKYWHKITGAGTGSSFVVYNGEENQKRTAGEVISWKNLDSILEKYHPVPGT